VYQGKENVDRAVIFLLFLYRRKAFPFCCRFPIKEGELPSSLLSLPPSLLSACSLPSCRPCT